MMILSLGQFPSEDYHELRLQSPGPRIDGDQIVSFFATIDEVIAMASSHDSGLVGAVTCR